MPFVTFVASQLCLASRRTWQGVEHAPARSRSRSRPSKKGGMAHLTRTAVGLGGQINFGFMVASGLRCLERFYTCSVFLRWFWSASTPSSFLFPAQLSESAGNDDMSREAGDGRHESAGTAPQCSSCGELWVIYIYIPRHSVCAIYADQLGVVLGVHGAAVLWQSHGVYGIYLYNPTS